MSETNEVENLGRIAKVYQSMDLQGINECYHIAVRDAMIPANGGTTALELGCGTGLWTCVLCQRYKEVDVVDASAELLANVADKCGQQAALLRSHNMLVERFLLRQGGKWRHIYVTFLLEHLRDPVDVLRLIRSRLSEDGSLFVAVPNADSIHRQLAVRMGLLETIDALSENDRRLGHRRVYSRALLRSQLVESGYSIAEENSIGFKPLSLAQMTSYSCDLVEALCASGDLVGEHAAYIGMRAEPL